MAMCSPIQGMVNLYIKGIGHAITLCDENGVEVAEVVSIELPRNTVDQVVVIKAEIAICGTWPPQDRK